MNANAATEGPLSAAAAAFERELSRYDNLTNELSRTSVRSQETLSRTQQLLSDAAACEEALGARLRTLLEAMNGARDMQQRCMEQTLEAARGLQTRASAFTALLERVTALGVRARETSEPAIEALTKSRDGEQGDVLVGSLQRLGDQMAEIVAEAAQLAQDADAGDWPDIARDVASLKQQMQSAHGRVVQACASVGSQLLS